ncbi:MAG: 50S ribosomal protein L23 [Bacteroidia bacterium]|nr:50S ribosomal protein L23 [Bacteroidia bacterium]
MNILHKPLISEKMTAISEKLNRYGFIVHPGANKIEIKKAVEDMYDVNVVSVNTMNYKGKIRLRSTKTMLQKGRTKAFKKAVVTLKEGDTIDFFAAV